ncbi:MAG: hypothetical protein CVT88_01540 [Candidatus Altiarchaeales archaeon HGW-Altiarchaeales-1]|nr:MAG: hypothetical protein CVT89_06430 [Candidatus Altiarchaeales archaeon HGW-Altiarchaeales-2]PKP60940.1 MAG: hypothetical protein CVT88_01540 [Candidatus Altiarchaeales archaeon HGW-Altiarchaeales-1]
MITNIQGEKYNFEIVAENECFYIKAKHKDTGRFSCINNLNIVLSELCGNMGNINDDKFQDSQWIVSKHEIKNFEKTAKELLSDKSFRDYLEEKLNEDRECGEWENV